MQKKNFFLLDPDYESLDSKFRLYSRKTVTRNLSFFLSFHEKNEKIIDKTRKTRIFRKNRIFLRETKTGKILHFLVKKTEKLCTFIEPSLQQ